MEDDKSSPSKDERMPELMGYFINVCVGLVQEQESEMAQERAERDERGGSGGGRLQERFRFAVQWADAALHRHRQPLHFLSLQ